MWYMRGLSCAAIIAVPSLLLFGLLKAPHHTVQCANEQNVFVVGGEVQPTRRLLLTEVAKLGTTTASFTVVNGTGNLFTIVPRPTCFCTSLCVDGVPTAAGIEEQLKPRSRRVIEVLAKIPATPGIHANSVLLECFKNGEPVKTMTLLVRHAVVDDFHCTPGRLIIEDSQIRYSLEARRATRGTAASYARPKFDLPNSVVLESMNSEPPVELEPNLWIVSWTADLVILPNQVTSDSSVTVRYEDGPQCRIPLVYRATGFQAPDRISFGVVTCGATVARAILISSDRDNDNAAAQIELNSPHFFVIRSRKDDEDRRHWIDIECRPNQLGNLKGVAVIRIGDQAKTISLQALCVR